MDTGEKLGKIRLLLVRWLPTLVVMVLIFIMSSMSSEVVSQQTSPITQPLIIVQRHSSLFSGLSDLPWLKIGHIIGYALLGLSIWWGLVRSKYGKVWLAVLLAFIYAGTDELHQSFVPGRSGSFNDVLLDTVAALLAIELFLFFRMYLKTKRQGSLPSESAEKKNS